MPTYVVAAMNGVVSSTPRGVNRVGRATDPLCVVDMMVMRQGRDVSHRYCCF